MMIWSLRESPPTRHERASDTPLISGRDALRGSAQQAVQGTL